MKKNLNPIWLSLAFVAGMSFAVACTPQQRAAVVDLVDAACVVIDVFADSPEASQVCALERDLAPFVEEVLKSKAKMGAGGPLATEVCVPIPEGDAFREVRPDDVKR